MGELQVRAPVEHAARPRVDARRRAGEEGEPPGGGVSDALRRGDQLHTRVESVSLAAPAAGERLRRAAGSSPAGHTPDIETATTNRRFGTCAAEARPRTRHSPSLTVVVFIAGVTSPIALSLVTLTPGSTALCARQARRGRFFRHVQQQPAAEPASEPDFALAYSLRVKALVCDVPKDEARAGRLSTRSPLIAAATVSVSMPQSKRRWPP